MRKALLAISLTACTASDRSGPDVPTPQPAHVVAPMAGTAIWSLHTATIDTTQMKVLQPFDNALPDGAHFDVAAQEGGPELAVLALGELDVSGLIRVRGSRPLVIVADRITIEEGATLDASAHGFVPGAGAQEGGPGAGADGVYGEDHFEKHSGGGGGSFGDFGGRGSLGTFPGVNHGDAELTILSGGSPGGLGGGISRSCAGFGGAGGGALQLKAGIVEIEGSVAANGGGGSGGATCGGGGGGGSGGAIYVQATVLLGNGWLTVNGGGGGGGGAENGAGLAGEDGQAVTYVAVGGRPGGGDGGAGTHLATEAFNGGGGGGGGRILVSAGPGEYPVHGSPWITRMP